MKPLLTAILDDDLARVRRLLKSDLQLVFEQIEDPILYQSKIFHWLYAGDTALHLAAAGYREKIVQALLAAGADPNAAANHRHSTPLHYAADGYIVGPAWDATRQVKTIRLLLKAGAEIDAADANGATALHRAVRTRCAAAVDCLLDAGANPNAKNKPGSTPFHLAMQTTGRGGSGAEIAIAAQREIIEKFLALGVSTAVKDGKGKTVTQRATKDWMKRLLVDGSTG